MSNELKSERKWTLWSDERPPNKSGSYRYRVTADILGLTLTPEWTEVMTLCGMGHRDSEWWPLALCRWDGYSRYITHTGLEWSELLEDDPENIIWGGLDLLSCPFSGVPPTIEKEGRYINAPVWHAEGLWISSPAVSSKKWTNAKAMRESWNTRAPCPDTLKASQLVVSDILIRYAVENNYVCCSGYGCGCLGATDHDEILRYFESEVKQKIRSLKSVAIDKLVQHDQEIGLYDTPECDVCKGLNISCPQGCQIVDETEWDEPRDGADAPLCQSPCPKFHKTRLTSDLPKCDGGKDCPKQWGEPFYGSPEIARYLGFIEYIYWWENVDKLWIILASIRDIADHIYSLPANHPFYETDLFANAKKPDANHPCRGGE